MLLIVGGSTLAASYAWEYRSQALADETTTIKESTVCQLNVDVTFGTWNVEITVETFTIPVLVTFWWLLDLNSTNSLTGLTGIAVLCFPIPSQSFQCWVPPAGVSHLR